MAAMKVTISAADVVVSNERSTSRLRPFINATRTTTPASETAALILGS